MAHISTAGKNRWIKKQVGNNVYRDILEITCENCFETYQTEFNSKMKCPFCNKGKDLLMSGHSIN